MELSRELQYELLNSCRTVYPNEHTPSDERGVEAKNLIYLQEHGLVVCTIHSSLSSGPGVVGARITHRGIDFLADDGGLTAILDVVTVRLHTDTIRQLIENHVDQSNMPAAEKMTIKDHLKTVPADTLSHLTSKLIDLGLKAGPGALEAIRKVLTP